MVLAVTTAGWVRLGVLIAVVLGFLYFLGFYDMRKDQVEKGEREDMGRIAVLGTVFGWPGRTARGIGDAFERLLERSKVLRGGVGAVLFIVGWIITLVLASVAVVLVVNLLGWIFAPDPCAEVSDGQASCPRWEFWP
jgi:hypothetical protein